MRKEKVDVPAGDGVADSYLVVPDGGPHPGVLLFMDAFGLRPRIEEMADRIAEAGYVVLAPNLLYRGGRSPQFDLSGLGDPDKRGEIFGKIMPLIQALGTDNAIQRDAEKYLDFLAAQEGVAAGPVVITGYCMGGTNALRVIEAFPDRVKAIAAFHAGGVVTDGPDSPHLGVGSITGEVYFGHADQDHSMSPEHIKTLEAALDEAGVTYRSEVYEGATHGYTMSDTAAYSEAGEKRHWDNLFALLERVK
ncbi:dienelactone hydrolase family protein [Amycolatopsis sp. FDAARGOS 1241]|uniref:dienelactone hydrolase family protein n=1 Tax=Amycolatopsis sp. FDAARGOS 1241 TaxID=2778070 RepID=UPI001950E314|nr:dienelactone hydrolase family protein [Amycolatopsis sp. FDAARGOS 1241]QRP49497.1 dienelactone hydrolase family protein [Amycolatopsis sp. FDAARGOS 1241]